MKTTLLLLALTLVFPCQGVYAKTNGETTPITYVRMSFGGYEAIVEMFDTPASRDFISLLPLTLEFSDFAGAEKIARNMPRRLDTQNSPTAAEIQGDFTYYAPWGNLAVFYKGFGTDGQLYTLGRIRTGKEHLATMEQNFPCTLELYREE